MDDIRGSLCLSPHNHFREFKEWARGLRKRRDNVAIQARRARVFGKEPDTFSIQAKGELERLDANWFKTWRDFTKSLEDIESMPLPEPSVLRRIVRVLGENQRLGQQIAQLKTQVDMLDVVTRNCYKIMGHAEPDPMVKSIKQTRDRLKFQALARTLATTISSSSSSGVSSQWFLELNMPEDFNGTVVVINKVIADCEMFFSVSSRAAIDSAPRSKEIRLKELKGALIPHSRPSDPLATAMSNIYNTKICNAVFHDVFLELRTHSTPLLGTQSWDTLLRAYGKYEKAMEVERAEMALCLTIWLILLWEMDWFWHICPCAFRSVVFQNEKVEVQTEENEHCNDAEDGQQTNFPYRQEHVYSAATRSSETQSPT